MQALNDRMSVARLRDALDLGDFRYDDAKARLTMYRKHLKERFDSDRRRQVFDVAQFFEKDTSQCWTGDGSVVFVLSGKNESGMSLEPRSWLSPVAVDLTQDYLATKRIVAFEMCDRQTTLEGLLARLSYQLLELNAGALRDPEEWSYLEKCTALRGDVRLKNLEGALLRIINLQREPVFIILNRPDHSEDVGASEYIRTMLNITKSTTGVLKVLIVVRAENWRLEEDKASTVPRGLDPKLLKTMRLDQRRVM